MLVLRPANRALREAEQARLALCAKREGLARELIAKHAELDGETLRISYAHMEFLAREINNADMQVAGCAHAVSVARDALVKASKDRKAIDRLRERRLQEHEAQERRFEQRDLDDANARLYGRNLREGATTL